MKLKTIIEAKEALVSLAEKRFSDYKKLREIVKLRVAVEAEYNFYMEQEKKAVETYAERTTDGSPAFLPDGRLKLKDVTAKMAFEADLAKLQDTEVDDIKPVTLAEKDFLSATELPTANDMIALEGIIIFED